MNDFIATVRSKVGPRTNLNPRDIAGWLVAPFILAIVIPTNEKIASNAVFFAAHGVSTVAWIIVLTGFLVVLWLILLALLGFAHRKMSSSAFDYLTSTIMFVTIWFLAGNLLCRSLFDSAPALGPSSDFPSRLP